MPQADLSYSAQIPLDAAAVLSAIEMVIGAHDTTSGKCKGRVHALAQTHHTHVLLRLRMLNKPHRDDAFMQLLLAALQEALRPLIPAPCILGIELGFLERHYASVTLD
jgi:cytochrome P450